MEYFKHDINASEDDKICELLANGGYEMFGYYWRFVEYLYSRGGFVYKNKLNSVAWILHMEIDKLNDLIYKFGLFVDSDETIYSKRVLQEVQDFEANGKRMAEIGRKGGQASAKAKAQADAQANGKAYAKPYAKADAQQKKENKKNKEKKENKINAPDGVSALTGKLPDGYSVHPNSGEVYTVIDGKMYNLNGDELNSAGFVVIDFGLSKHNL
jgi:general stress protein YciG